MKVEYLMREQERIDEHCKELGSAIYQRDKLIEEINGYNQRIELLKREIERGIEFISKDGKMWTYKGRYKGKGEVSPSSKEGKDKGDVGK